MHWHVCVLVLHLPPFRHCLQRDLGTSFRCTAHSTELKPSLNFSVTEFTQQLAVTFTKENSLRASGKFREEIVAALFEGSTSVTSAVTIEEELSMTESVADQ